jgi:hypothetical protein
MSEEDFASRNTGETSAATPDGAATGFTPGPWFSDCTDEVLATLDGGAVVVIAVINPLAELNGAATEANARLIAAAPDLYAVLRAMFVEGPVHVALAGNPIACDALERRARAALVKADGSAERVAATPAQLGPGTNNNV